MSHPVEQPKNLVTATVARLTRQLDKLSPADRARVFAALVAMYQQQGE